MPEIPSYVEAVPAALRFSGARPEALRTMKDSEWKDLLSRGYFVHLTVPLRQVCSEDVPAWVRSKIDLNLSDNAKRFDRVKAVYRELATALLDAGTEHMVLKGFAQFPGYTEHPRLRFQGDIDLYCPPDSIFRARDALLALGYVPSK